MGFSINDEHKIRITLSNRAAITMNDDMETFHVPNLTRFINTIFGNYREEATSSIALHLQNFKSELENRFANTTLDDDSKEIAIDALVKEKEKELKESVNRKREKKNKNRSQCYYINKDNIEYLNSEECLENKYYKSPGAYICSVIEEYCSLPFIKRERICKKDYYETITRSIKDHNLLEIKTEASGKKLTLHVWPYKIVSDVMNTQEYLACYSKVKGSDEEKECSSFSMARLNKLKVLKTSGRLTENEKKKLESELSTRTAAYLLKTVEENCSEKKGIAVRLTEAGKNSYKRRLYSRPEREVLSAEDERYIDEDTYIFTCSYQQIWDYFSPFGDKAEILNPPNLRKRFKQTAENMLQNYQTPDTPEE